MKIKVRVIGSFGPIVEHADWYLMTFLNYVVVYYLFFALWYHVPSLINRLADKYA